MTQMELLMASSTLLKTIIKNKIKIKDVEYIEMVNKADYMLSQGEQKTYVVQKLAEEYHVSVRSVYSIIDRLHCLVSVF